MRPTGTQAGLAMLFGIASATGPQAQSEVVTALAEVRPSDFLDEFDALLTTDRAFRERVLRNSTVGTNGFLRIVLSESDNPQHIRLHVWLRDVAVDTPDIHNHRWPYVSKVICGTLAVDEFEESDDQEGIDVTKFLHEAEPSTKSFRLTHLGPTRLKRLSSALYDEGSVYATEPNTLHRVRADTTKSLTATLMVELSRVAKHTHVYRTSGEQVEPQSRETLSEERVRNLISQIRASCTSMT